MSQSHAISIFLGLLTWLILFLSFVSLIFIAIQWQNRSRQGISINNGVDRDPFNFRELLLLAGMIVLFYSFGELLGIALKKYGFMETEDRQALFSILFTVLWYAVILSVIGILLKRKNLSWSEAFGLKKSGPFRALFTAIIALVAVFIPLEILSAITQFIYHLFGQKITPQEVLEIFEKIRSPLLKIGFIGVATIGAPIVEEVLFRGLLYPHLKRQFGFVHGIWITSLLFALSHLHLPSLLPLFGLAVMINLVYEWRGNLGTSMILHSVFNATSLTFLIFKDHLNF